VVTRHAPRFPRISQSLHRARTREKEQKDTESNQSWESSSNAGVRNAREDLPLGAGEKEQVGAKEDDGKGMWRGDIGKNGWLAVLADQISRMARAPLNRFYFCSCCSERGEGPDSNPSQNVRRMLSPPEPLLVPSHFFLSIPRPGKSIRESPPLLSRTIELDPCLCFFGGSQNEKSEALDRDSPAESCRSVHIPRV